MYFIDYAVTVLPFFLPFIPLCPVIPLPPSFPHVSSCPWVVHGSSLASPFPILFLTSPVYFVSTIYASYSLYLFSHCPPLCLPTDNPPCDLHFCESVPVLFVCLVFVFVFLGLVVESYKFIVILLFIFLIFFFFDEFLYHFI